MTSIEGTRYPDILDRVARVAKVFDRENRSHPKILNLKQMLQRLSVSFAQVKAGNISENILNEIRQIIYSLFRPKEITKKSIQQYAEFNKVVKQNGYYIYES